MSEYLIEGGIEVPAIQPRRSYPFDALKIGQSFAVGVENAETLSDEDFKTERSRLRAQIASSAASFMRRNPTVTLVVRICPQDITRVRCWRTKPSAKAKAAKAALQAQAGEAVE